MDQRYGARLVRIDTDMDLGWLVLMASMSMSIFVCVSSFHENDTKVS